MKEYAKKYLDAGINVIPTKPDKAPAIPSWTGLQKELITVNGQFDDAYGIGLICGKISGNLEVLDFDLKNDETGEVWRLFNYQLDELLPEISKKLIIQQSPSGGFHIFYRCDTIEGNKKLARNIKKEVVIETRGEGGYVCAFPTPGYVVKSGKFSKITKITTDQRETILNICRSFDSYKIIEDKEGFVQEGKKVNQAPEGKSPLDDYNERSDSLELLQNHGWTIKAGFPGKYYLTRPGSKSRSVHATLRYLNGVWIFYNFSSHEDFEDKGYTPVQLFRKYECKDAGWSDVAKKLLDLGYGERIARKQPEKTTRKIQTEKPLRKKDVLEFPFHVFPDSLNAMFDEYSSKRDYPKDLLAFAVLNVFSGAIGYNYVLKLHNDWEQTCLLFSCLVGTSSIGKSPTMKFAATPLAEYEAELAKRYKIEFNEWIQEKDKPAKDRNPLICEPLELEVLINDITMEKIGIALETNPKGLILIYDELAGWVKKMGAYNQANDHTNWNNLWSNNFIKTGRVSRKKIFVPKTFLSVLGGIQPSTLKELAGGAKGSDGFLYRFLFVFANEPEFLSWEQMKTKANEELENKYHQMINFYLRQSYRENPTILRCSDEADEIWGQWYDENKLDIRRFATEGRKDLESIWGKMSHYCARFALLIELIWQVAEGKQSSLVSEQSMLFACHLAEYFKKTSQIALETIEHYQEEENEEKKTLNSKVDWRQVFKGDSELETAEIINRMHNLYGYSRRTVKYYIKNELTKIEHGKYTI